MRAAASSITIPARRWHPAAYLFFLLPIAVPVLLVGPFSQFFRQSKTPDVVSSVFLAFLIGAFGVLPAYSALSAFLKSRRGRTTVTVSAAGVRMEERRVWKTRTHRVARGVGHSGYRLRHGRLARIVERNHRGDPAQAAVDDRAAGWRANRARPERAAQDRRQRRRDDQDAAGNDDVRRRARRSGSAVFALPGEANARAVTQYARSGRVRRRRHAAAHHGPDREHPGVPVHSQNGSPWSAGASCSCARSCSRTACCSCSCSLARTFCASFGSSRRRSASPEASCCFSSRCAWSFPREGGVAGEPLEGEPFLVPLAIPLFAGPSTLAALLLLQRSSPGDSTSLLIAVTIAWAIGGAILLSSTFFYRVLRERGLIAIERLMGMLLVMVSVQMLVNGLKTLLRGPA